MDCELYRDNAILYSSSLEINIMKKILLGLGVVLVLVACQKEPEPVKTVVSDTGRAETKNIEAADAMGYNGKEIRKKLDGALDANDAHNAQLEQQGNQ
jgi:hypothetical protein